MLYNDILKEIISDCKKDVERFVSGDKESYLYKKVRDKQYGNTDGNYLNRTRLCYGLIYNDFPDYDIEKITRELFETEVISRENESFQGIGVNLEILTVLMKRYEKPDDRKLFERAKNANFDCYCGYEENLNNFDKPVENLSLRECIYTAYELHDTEKLFRMVDIFKENISTKEDYEMLDNFASLTERMSDRKISSEYLYNYYISSPDENKYLKNSAAGRYLRCLIDDKQAEKAEEIFVENFELFSDFDRRIYEFGYQIMLLNPPHKEKIWKMINPAIIRSFKNIAPMDCGGLAECAEMMGEKKLAKQLMKLYSRKMKGIRNFKKNVEKSSD